MIKKLEAWFWKGRIESALIWLKKNCYDDVVEADFGANVLLNSEYSNGSETIKILFNGKPVYELIVNHRISYRYSSSPVTELERYNFGSWVYVVWGIYEKQHGAKLRQEAIIERAKFQPLDE